MDTRTCAIILSGIAFLCGCTTNGHDNRNVFVNPSTPDIELADGPANLVRWSYVDKGEDNFLLSEVRDIHIIPLKTPAEEVIGKVTDCRLFGDTIVVVDAYKAQKIYLFTKDGAFIRTIGAAGNGPGEYSSVNGIYFGDKTMSVLDWMSWKYITYDLDGNTTSEKSFANTRPANLQPLNGNVFLGSHNGYSKNNKFALSWIRNDSVEHTGLPYKWNRPEVAGKFFTDADGHALLFQHGQTDTVYSVSDSVIEPAFSLGLHDKGEVWSFVESTKELSNGDYRKRLSGLGGEFPSQYSLFRLNGKWLVLHHDHDKACLSVKDDNDNAARSYNVLSFKTGHSNYAFNFVNAYDKFLIASIDDSLLQLPEEDFSDGISKLPAGYHDLLMNYNYAAENPILLILEM